MAELADALDSKSSGAIRAGSSPASGIKRRQQEKLLSSFYVMMNNTLKCILVYDLKNIDLHIVRDNVKLRLYQYLYHK